MSVPPGDRKPSDVQFIETAERIESRAIDICRKWPKSWMFVLTQRTVALASSIYEHAQRANEIFPITSEEERAERLIELHRAMGSNYCFAKKMELAFHKFPICGERRDASPEAMQEKSGKILEEFMIMCAEEKRSLIDNIRYTRQIQIGGDPEEKPEKPPEGQTE